MATAEDLIGIWSADARYGPGAQSDEMMLFKPDGTGRMEFWNWQLCSADFFQWHVVSPGVVTTRLHSFIQGCKPHRRPPLLSCYFRPLSSVSPGETPCPLDLLRWPCCFSRVRD